MGRVIVLIIIKQITQQQHNNTKTTSIINTLILVMILHYCVCQENLMDIRVACIEGLETELALSIL